ncbi:MAG: tyrosine-protein phosphatase [Firmicutes bacterium]|nr:tyrosine-protein phosphatase [Bacillota bacterium]MBR3719388.1 tyrosine-protein phosphatase [Bacillota bacterium]
MKKRSITVLLIVCLVFLLAACTKAEETPDVPGITDVGILHEPEFGGVYVQNTIEEFNAKGFAYGDSVDLTFSNGYTLEDLPYYNGYYVQTGEPLFIAYPGYDYVKAAINNGDDLWVVAGLSEDDTASVTLREVGKYKDIQEARDIHYKDDRSLFESDEVFANFRAMQAGQLRSGILYRSASPCDNQHNRAPYVDALIQNAGVQYILDLADTEEKIAGYMAKEDFASPYFAELHENGCVDPIGLNMNFGSEEFRGKIAAGLTRMAESNGPYLIHCTEGKDRTGFVCMLLEALCGASYEEIRDDYMITYDNYYQISPEKDPARYNTIVENVLDPMIRSMAGDSGLDLQAADLSEAAEKFLFSGGMKTEEIEALKVKIME